MPWHGVAKDCTRDQVQQWIADDLSKCAAHGKKFGVIIGVQNHGDFLQTGEQLLALINAVNSPWCGVSRTGKAYDPFTVVPAFQRELQAAIRVT